MPQKDPITILLVDDEEMVLTSLRSFLAIETNYRVLAYTSPLKALAEMDHQIMDFVGSEIFLFFIFFFINIIVGIMKLKFLIMSYDYRSQATKKSMKARNQFTN